MNENDIKIINTSYHKKMTDNHLAQVNFTATIPRELWDMYISRTSLDHEALGRIRFMTFEDAVEATFRDANGNDNATVRVFGRVSHGYGYGIEQDIFNSIMDSKGVK